MTRIVSLIANEYSFVLWGIVALLCWQVPRLAGKGWLSLAFLLLAGESLLRAVASRDLDAGESIFLVLPWLRLLAMGCFLMGGLQESLGGGWVSPLSQGSWEWPGTASAPRGKSLLGGVAAVGVLGAIALGALYFQYENSRQRARFESVEAQVGSSGFGREREAEEERSRQPLEMDEGAGRPSDERPEPDKDLTPPDKDVPGKPDMEKPDLLPPPPPGGAPSPEQKGLEDTLKTFKEMKDKENAEKEERKQTAAAALRLAVAAQGLDDKDQVEKAYAEAVDRFAQLANDFPLDTDVQAGLGLALARRGEFRAKQQEWSTARDDLDRAVDLLQAAKANLKDPDLLRALRDSQANLAEALLQLDNPVGAAKAAAALPQVFSDNGDDFYLGARYLARSAAAAEKAELKNDEEKPLGPIYAEDAVALLQEAVQHGYKDLESLQKEPDLDALRPREDFQKVVEDLKAKNS